MNGLDSWGTNIGNVCLEAFAQEKVRMISGPEFRPVEGHELIINKALCGLRTSGLNWHKRLLDCLRDMNFFPCKIEPDI